MVDTNSRQAIEGFMHGIQEIADIIEREDPDVLLFPVKGAVPIVDLLLMVDPAIAQREYQYLPASSTIVDTNANIKGWFKKYLADQHTMGEHQSFLSIDEVASGNSAARVARQMRNAAIEFLNEQGVRDTGSEVSYRTIGIEDARYSEKQKPYQKLNDLGIVIPVSVPAIITMDRPSLTPLILTPIPKHPQSKVLPVMESVNVTSDYLTFLERCATAIGKNPEQIVRQPTAKIRASERFLLPQYASVEAYQDFARK